jgi:hypothetical protein
VCAEINWNDAMSSKRIVVVLGSGRSGTSLVMQTLHALGMQVSENLTEASVANPLGPLEDKEIFDFQSSLIQELGGHVAAPMPDDWLRDKLVFRAMTQLEALIENRLEKVDGLFGFKDPKTSMLIPLWVRVFNRMKLIPAYVLTVRDPGATVASFLMQYNSPAYMAELVWLVRTVEAIDNTAADCFVAHYEDWFDEPLPLAQSLLHYTGLDKTFKGDLSEVLAQKVKSNLNRASKDDYEIQNPYVKKLYSALQQCRGADFYRDRLMAVVKECRQAMEGFKGWYQLAHQSNKKLADTQGRLDKADAAAAKVKTLEARIRELEAEKIQNAQWVQQVQKLERQFEQLLAVKFEAP